jgi:hypothetical protein
MPVEGLQPGASCHSRGAALQQRLIPSSLPLHHAHIHSEATNRRHMHEIHD